MKIRFVTMAAFARGGTARTTIDSANRLVQLGHDVEIISVLRRDAGLFAYLHPNVKIRALYDLSSEAPKLGMVARGLAGMPSVFGPAGDPSTFRFSLLTDVRLIRDIRSMRSGVLIGTRPLINVMIARYARPSVWAVAQEHQHFKLWKPALRREMRAMYARLDAATALTAADGKVLRSALPDHVLVRTIPNAHPEVGAARAALDRPLVVASGRLATQKGYSRLIKAFGRVVDDHPDWKLVIYGEGPKRASLTDLIDRLDLNDHVTLPGFVDDLPARLSEGSIYALSSRYEGLPLALLEAMACGLPPVAFNCRTGPREVITRGQSGLLVSEGDVAGLAKGIRRLIEDPDLRRRIGANARIAAARFSSEAVSRYWQDFLDELTARPPGERRGPMPRPSIRRPHRRSPSR